MDLKDMILVMENYKGTERNMLMTLEDYKKFVAIDDMSELADQMLLLGRTLIFQINDLSGIKMCDEDIVVILSNLLNNAIEACEKCSGKKFMKMKLVKEKDNIIISVKNTYDGKLNIKDGEIQTSKKYEMDEHGVGIKNIIEVITKYQGSYAIRNDNNEFYFSVILPN